MEREEFAETHVIPSCPDETVEDAVHEAVERGTVWLTSGPTSVWKEPIPYGALRDDAVLHPKPDPILVQELVADSLPGAWRDGKTNGVALAQALSQARGPDAALGSGPREHQGGRRESLARGDRG